ncbi:UNVERIFIED_CONTAM: U3 small nucleolar RNA-associated protein 17 [Sesamum radiatum]|uniref:U3 small nucleolar RNA-associated protein 17 n=1 Tax=Sesamum radiatum TaxID=300843 RepID=A0AAW2KH32_SESRA
MITGGKSFVSSPPAFSNDAKRLLVCTGNTVSVFSTSTGLQISELEGHGAQVTSVIVVPASSPASKLMCYCWTASLDGKIKYWDFAAPELMTTIDIGSPIHSMVIPSLLSQSTENNGKRPDLFAYIFTEDVKHKEEKTNCLCGQIQKCNLTKSRIVGGVTLAKTQRPGSITSSPSGKYIGTYERRKLRIWEIPEKDSEHVGYKKIRLHHTKSFTALAFHPTERVVAAGDITGRILIWRGVGHKTCLNDGKLINGGLNTDAEDKPGVRDDDDADSCTTWHWHSSQVNVLFFSSDGAYLYSGGREGVLVVWQLDTGKKKFLPRIGAPLLYFVNSPDPSLSSISRADNQIQLLRMPSMEILRSISGIKVQICERNHQPGDEITVIRVLSVIVVLKSDTLPVVKVNLVALSPDGSTMSTVETRLPEEGIGSLVSLKFWACGSQNKHFSLSTVIYEPHGESGISSVAFRPTSHMAVSSSYGGDFKVWVRRHEISTEDETVENTGWRCHAVGSYKDIWQEKPMTAAAFSGDGSVLAVAAEKVITLWDPDRNALLAVIGDSLEPITTLSFVGKSEYLVSASRGFRSTVDYMEHVKAVYDLVLQARCRGWVCCLQQVNYYISLTVACSVDKSTFAVLALIKPAKHMEPTEASLHSAEGVILLFNVENPVPLSTWFVSKAQSGRLSFVWSSPKSEDDVAETKSFDEVLAYINGAHEYVL